MTRSESRTCCTRWVTALCALLGVAMPWQVAARQAPGQQASALQVCETTAPVHARAPHDSHADPVTGWWHISSDNALWAPSTAPGQAALGVGNYWVRPAGQPLTVRGRRLDAVAPPVEMVESGGAANGFYYGGPALPTEGCWQFEAASGASRVTFVTEVHDGFQAFATRPQSRVTWSQEVGRIESGDARMVVTALVVEDPATRTQRQSGARIQLSDGRSSALLYEARERLEGTRRILENAAVGREPTLVYGLGRTHNIVAATTLTIVGSGHTFVFAPQTHADAARLLVAAGDLLRARQP